MTYEIITALVDGFIIGWLIAMVIFWVGMELYSLWKK